MDYLLDTAVTEEKNFFLAHHEVMDGVYKAIAKPDLSEGPMTVLDVLVQIKSMPKLEKEKKSVERSTFYRTRGNTAYGKKEYQQALGFYNIALLYAPKGSRELILAYSNRSALLYSLNFFTKCLKDIKLCFSLGCPPDIVDKLRKRQESAEKHMWLEIVTHLKMDSYLDAFFREIKNNPLIPSASTNVGGIVENRVPKIIATKDTNVGEVLAIEEAFVTTTFRENLNISCYYCQKIDLNLMPCHSCLIALFCSEECRENCLRDYHSIECEIIEVLDRFYPNHSNVSRMAIKAILKMLHLSNSWKELIAESQLMGMRRIKTSSINNIFDVNYKYSLLNTKEEKHFLHGAMFNGSFSCAVIIHLLDMITKIFPENSDEKTSAMRAFARIYMFLNTYCFPTQLIPAITLTELGKIKAHDLSNYGWFPLIGKLGYSCTPNTVIVNLNRSLALISVRPIKCGDPLTVMMVDTWYQKDPQVRNYNMVGLYGTVCNCTVCRGEYEHLASTALNVMQKKSFRRLDVGAMHRQLNATEAPEFYIKICKTLSVLSDVPFSKEYSEVCNVFRRCIMYFQDFYCKNTIIQ